MKRGLHTIRHRLQFLWMRVATENKAKKVFEFFKKLPTLANTFRKKVFHKMPTNLTNHSLHTIRISNEFYPFVPFCHCLRIVCNGLVCSGVSFSAPHFLQVGDFTLPILCSIYLRLTCPHKEPHQQLLNFPVQFVYILDISISWSFQTCLSGCVKVVPELVIARSLASLTASY